MKIRYSQNFKYRMVKLYLKHGVVPRYPYSKRSTFVHQVVLWTKIYKKFGYDGLANRRRILTFAQKVQCIKRFLNGETKQKIMLDYGIIGGGSLNTWINLYNKGGFSALRRTAIINSSNYMKKPLTKDERKELEDLRIEVEVLKKLNALIQPKELRTKKKLKSSKN